MSTEGLSSTVSTALNNVFKATNKPGKFDKSVLDDKKIQSAVQSAKRKVVDSAVKEDNITRACWILTGILSTASILGSSVITYSLQTKGKDLKKSLIAAALLVASVGAIFLCVKFRNNFRKNLAEEALQKLSEEKEYDAMCLIARGADLSEKGEALSLLSAEKGYVKAFSYLAFLEKSKDPAAFKKRMTQAFNKTTYDSISQLAFAFGAEVDIKDDIDLKTLIQKKGSKCVLRMGIDPNRVLNFLADLESIQLAISYGAGVKNKSVDDLFNKACLNLDNSVIASLLKLGAETARFNIENQDYEKWEKELAAFRLPSERDQKVCKQPRLIMSTPFETYIRAHFEKKGSLSYQDFNFILQIFQLSEEALNVLSFHLSDAPAFCKKLNDMGIRIRLSHCENLLRKLREEFNKSRAVESQDEKRRSLNRI